ncbi:GNAT family N-acetyltransferase [Candidatus Kryptonium thompsonii]|uniref:GNAT family N-acetyltransferase n=1 Tax=Candidatus Kryptonium thompsonii TaxID=1633631 RepID=UPI0007076464|nr:GNAT family N-acetyltransferase [Candidatus Kryptonium thompsoni]CUS77097.1 Acetyltransferase (GNAT) domain-containing protein [Candidatus Kryptonium thompsoni]CUT06914.1 Acetyltransferase (GNAT) domain-containing protein [Candidatus Kryptonium thompsoni]
MAQLHVEISNDPEEWNKFNIHSPQSNPFQSYDWLKVYSEFFNLSLNILLVRKGEEIISGLIYPFKKKFLFKVSTPLLFTYYTGILFQDFKGEKIQKRIMQKNEAILKIHQHLERTLDFFTLKLHYTIDDVRQFKWLGYKIKPRHTFILNIESIEKLWDGLSNSLKRKIKDAREQGFKLVKTTSVDELAQQQILSFERTGGKFFLNFNELKQLLEKLVQKKLLTIYYLIDKNDQIVASRGVSIWNGKAYDIVAGTIGKEIDNASHFLVWKILEDLSSNNVKEFDFCGADIESVAFFKMQFGGEIKISFEVSYTKGLLKFLI